MIRLSFLSTGSIEQVVTFHQRVIRFGRGKEYEISVEPREDPRVAPHQGDFVLEGDTYFVVDRESRYGLWLNGKRIHRAPILGGERIHLGSANGPEIRVLQVLEATASDSSVEDEEDSATVLVSPAALLGPRPGQSSPPIAPPLPASRPLPRVAPGSRGVFLGDDEAKTMVTRVAQGALRLLVKPHEEVQQWLSRAQQDIAKARRRAKGKSSGDTMVIMAQALSGIRQSAESRTRRWRRGLFLVLVASLAVVVGLSGVVWWQRKQITRMVSEKQAIDQQIQAIFAQMATETDETRLAELEARQQALMGRAADKLVQVKRVNPQRAEALAEPVDELEQEIRKILHSFNAETYAIPPIFKETLQAQVDELRANKALRRAYARKQRYWPKIQRALEKKQLPEELGYITYTESRFDPTVVNEKSGASGMWQLMDETARACGITVREGLDERFDPGRASTAAACYLSKLLIEFGEESFMLVLASYNRGEAGVRHALHRVAKEPGGYRKRDFWHLYRMKLLPEETRDYVPKVLAAAIVFGNPEKYGVVAEE